MIFTHRNFYGLLNKVLGACIRTRNYGSNPHGNVKKIDTMKTSPAQFIHKF